MEVLSFPRAGINHPVVHVPSYHRVVVSQDEFDMLMRYRKDIADYARRKS